jgi:hypothetical protein
MDYKDNLLGTICGSTTIVIFTEGNVSDGNLGQSQPGV